MYVSEFNFSVLYFVFSSFELLLFFIKFSEFFLEMLSHFVLIFCKYVISWHFNISFKQASLVLSFIINWIGSSNKSLFKIPVFLSEINIENLFEFSFNSLILLILFIGSSGNSKCNKQLLLYIIPVFRTRNLKSNLYCSLLELFFEWIKSQPL